MEQGQPPMNTRRNCDYCVEKKVRCSGRIEGGACAYCTRKKHDCVFSVKQKPGPKCLRHHCEEESSAEGSPAVFGAVSAISSAAAALSLHPTGTASGSPAPPSAKSGGGGRSAGGGGGGGRHAASLSSSSSSASTSPTHSKRKVLGPAAAAARLLEEAGAGGKPATFLDLGPDGGASLPGLPGKANGGAPSMTSASPRGSGPGAGAGTEAVAGASRLMDRIGGDKPLSVGTLGAGNGGSFVSGLSALGSGGGAGGHDEEEDEEEDHRAVFAKIFEELGSDDSEDEQQNQPPANKKAKTDPFRGLHASLHQQLQDLQQHRKPRRSRPSGGDGGGGGGPPPHPPRHDAPNPSTTTAQRIATHAAAAAAAVAAEIAKVGGAPLPQPQLQHHHQHNQQQQQQQQRRLLSHMDSTGSWRRLLSNRNSFVMDCDGSSASGNNGSSSVGRALTSESSWASRGAAAAAAAADTGGGASAVDATANPFMGGFRGGRVGPVAEPLDPLMHARSHSYGLGDWLPPADITRDRDLDAFAGALPGAVAAAAADDGIAAATPLTGGIVAGRDHQF
eukprot:g7727.t1